MKRRNGNALKTYYKKNPLEEIGSPTFQGIIYPSD